MPSLSDIVRAIGEIISLIAHNATSAILSAIGILCLVIALVTLYKAVSAKPEDQAPWMRWVLFVSFTGGMIFSIAGPCWRLFELSQSRIRVMPKETAFDRLESNTEVSWLIRLVPFDDLSPPDRDEGLHVSGTARQGDRGHDPDASIGKLKRLGREGQLFTFVAPYDELRGNYVAEAVERLGEGHMPQHVSAIIFPVPNAGRTRLYPANARGMLQVVQEVERSDRVQISKPLLRDNTELDSDDVGDLRKLGLWTWRFENWKARYPKYCRLTHRFQCDASYSARAYIGEIGSDWHPIGMSEAVIEDPCNVSADEFCKIANWVELRESLLPHFGSRIFLLENLALDTIANRYMIDFDHPAHQVIPDIGLTDP
jgi:hypothetical protein